MKYHTYRALLLAGLLLAKQAFAESHSQDGTPPEVPVGWTLGRLPSARADVVLSVLMRPALFPPVRYRAIVVPGSGCTGWLPLVEPFFAGLLHAELLVLHKPNVNINAGAAAECSSEFIQNDSLSGWRDDARTALKAYFSTLQAPSQTQETPLPTLLIGLSEGAELLPYLAADVPALAGLVMISAPGLDPRETGALQAQRLGQVAAWNALDQAQASDASDATVQEGRTLRYWRDFWHWSLREPLQNAPWPVLRVWGDADASVPVQAYEQFLQQSRHRVAPMCDLRLSGADHGLQGARIGQSSQQDGLQWLWAQLEMWARQPGKGLCESVQP
ncbi:MAG: alpha/beta hydrolase [Rhodoferax sp.]|nr:alpha/beta hydrolase [Rhodoferax sp.]